MFLCLSLKWNGTLYIYPRALSFYPHTGLKNPFEAYPRVPGLCFADNDMDEMNQYATYKAWSVWTVGGPSYLDSMKRE